MAKGPTKYANTHQRMKPVTAITTRTRKEIISRSCIVRPLEIYRYAMTAAASHHVEMPEPFAPEPERNDPWNGASGQVIAMRVAAQRAKADVRKDESRESANEHGTKAYSYPKNRVNNGNNKLRG